MNDIPRQQVTDNTERLILSFNFSYLDHDNLLRQEAIAVDAVLYLMVTTVSVQSGCWLSHSSTVTQLEL